MSHNIYIENIVIQGQIEKVDRERIESGKKCIKNQGVGYENLHWNVFKKKTQQDIRKIQNRHFHEFTNLIFFQHKKIFVQGKSTYDEWR